MCIKLGSYSDYTEMHSQQNIKKKTEIYITLWYCKETDNIDMMHHGCKTKSRLCTACGTRTLPLGLLFPWNHASTPEGTFCILLVLPLYSELSFLWQFYSAVALVLVFWNIKILHTFQQFWKDSRKPLHHIWHT